ncbi:hypothetical protein KKF82_05280 [Patescibacteria group bacterium]|uniref:Uncharacterized protein n=1 Tax=viral metagenome TaxID=1070528 RepID=A0A6M3MCT9_9ZZZZ|nr:hypothetical protein [Patescibacteria group bacterium]
MSACDICDEYSDDLHPVGFISKFSARNHKLNLDEKTHEELLSIERSLAIERWNGETDPLTGEPDYFSQWSVYLCHECFNKYYDYIQTWG